MTNPFNAGNTATKAAPPGKKAAPAKAAAKAGAAEEAPEAGTPVSPGRAGGDPFASPSSSMSEYKISDLLGELLMVRPYEADKMITSVSKGELQDYVRAELIRLDNENERVDDVLVFQTVLVRSFKKIMRGYNVWTVGRLELGTAKGGKNAPYLLNEATPEEVQQAVAVATQLGLQLHRDAPILTA